MICKTTWKYIDIFSASRDKIVSVARGKKMQTWNNRKNNVGIMEFWRM